MNAHMMMMQQQQQAAAMAAAQQQHMQMMAGGGALPGQFAPQAMVAPQQMMYQQQLAGYGPQFAYLGAAPMPTQGWWCSYLNGLQPHVLQQFAMFFQAIDRDRSGSLTAQELMSIQFNMRNISFGTASCLLKMVDTDQSESVNFWEYAALHSFIMQAQNAFVQADFDRSGRISLNEITTALAGMGFALEPALVMQLVRKFDDTKTGHLAFDGFLALCAHLGLCKSLFEFNARGAPQIVLNFMQFSSLATSFLP